MVREGIEEKAARYLLGARVTVERVDSRWIVASVRGDGAVYRTTWHRGEWSCDCPARTRCAHLLALQKITAPERKG